MSNKKFTFLARATVGTLLYVYVCQLVSPLVSQLISVFIFHNSHKAKTVPGPSLHNVSSLLVI